MLRSCDRDRSTGFLSENLAILQQSSVTVARNIVHSRRVAAGAYAADFFHQIFILIAMLIPWLIGLRLRAWKKELYNIYKPIRNICEIRTEFPRVPGCTLDVQDKVQKSVVLWNDLEVLSIEASILNSKALIEQKEAATHKDGIRFYTWKNGPLTSMLNCIFAIEYEARVRSCCE